MGDYSASYIFDCKNYINKALSQNYFRHFLQKRSLTSGFLFIYSVFTINNYTTSFFRKPEIILS